jgi:hypothetical protein
MKLVCAYLRLWRAAWLAEAELNSSKDYIILLGNGKHRITDEFAACPYALLSQRLPTA